MASPWRQSCRIGVDRQAILSPMPVACSGDLAIFAAEAADRPGSRCAFGIAADLWSASC